MIAGLPWTTWLLLAAAVLPGLLLVAWFRARYAAEVRASGDRPRA